MTQSTSAKLLKTQRFLPYFITQFFGAFNDNIFKNVLLLFVAFAGPQILPLSSNLFINLAAGLFILPFFLFSATAGVLADRYEKAQFIRKVKLAEIVIMILGAIGFITQSYLILLVLLFLMGTQSAFFGPVKYALLPQQLKDNELLAGNALVETGTFLAILLGTLGAGIIASVENAHYVAAASVLVFAFLGYLSSRFIPTAAASNPHLDVHWRPISQTRETLTIAHQDKVVSQCIMAISWFWFLGASYLTQFPNFTKIHLLGNEAAVAVLLSLFSVGIALGSLLCTKLSKDRIDIGIVPIGSVGISLFGFLMASSIPDNLPQFVTVIDFICHDELWPLFFYLLALGASGGLFIVPLYALMQKQAKEGERARVIAALNIYNSLFMVVSAVIGIITLSVLELSIVQLFLILSLLNLVMALNLIIKAPIFAVRFLVWVMTTLCYRVTHKNLHLLPENGGALLVCNHVSYMDALIISAASPRLIRFVMEEDYANYPPVRRFLRRAGVIPISAQRKGSIRRAFIEIEQALAQGEIVCIFPEGRLTADGEMQPFMRGLDLILKRSPAPVIPLAIKGLWGSFYSRHKGRACKGIPSRFRAKIEVEAGEPVSATVASSQLMFEKVSELRGDYR